MGLWNFFRNTVEKKVHSKDQADKIYPESSGEITVEAIKDQLKDINDAIIKEVEIDKEILTLIYLGSLVKTSEFQEIIIDPLHQIRNQHPKEVFKTAEEIPSDRLPLLIRDVLSGYTILLFSHTKLILKVNTYSAPQRSISSSETETTVLGPQDAFTESLQTNLSLIKRRLRSPHLKTREIILGTETNNTVSLLYMENIANEENVNRLLRRLKNIEHEGFVGLSVLSQMIEDKPYSPFPQFGLTTRPDNATASLLDGRILVMMDGSPEAMIAPATFFEMFASPEDFYNRWTTASLLRTIRFVGFFVSIMFTSTYVSVLTYHQEMLPPQELLLLSESRSRVPFPPVLEVLLMELTIDILREAGSRMPTKIGQTIGIVGGIVIGTAAVEAGLASNILIVVVAISALLSFLPSNYLMSNASRFVRYVFIVAAGMLGIYGQMAALAWLMIHLLSLTSLGTPFFTPFIPRSWTDWGNSVFRAPVLYLVKRMGVGRVKKHLNRPLDEE